MGSFANGVPLIIVTENGMPIVASVRPSQRQCQRHDWWERRWKCPTAASAAAGASALRADARAAGANWAQSGVPSQTAAEVVDHRAHRAKARAIRCTRSASEMEKHYAEARRQKISYEVMSDVSKVQAAPRSVKRLASFAPATYP